MVQDRHLLLTPHDWLRIAAVAVEEAAANPHRLFKLDHDSIGTALPQDLLSVAAAELAAGGRRAGGVLFGATLCEAMLVLLRAAVSQVHAASA